MYQSNVSICFAIYIVNPFTKSEYYIALNKPTGFH